MKKIVCLIAGLLLIGAVMTACNGNIQLPPSDTGAATDTAGGNGSQPTESTPGDSDHTHTFYDYWDSDDSRHWHTASCGHDVKDGMADHVDANSDDVCDVCGQRKNHVHAYEEAWTINENTHYHKNTCGHDDVEKYREGEAPHADENNDGLCDVCSYDYGHTHTYDTEHWVKTDDGHWHAPTCGHTIPGSDLTAHIDENNDGICDGCGYDYDHTHTWSETYSHNDDDHWREVTCGHNIPVADKNGHEDGNGDTRCDVCGYQPEHFHEYDKTQWISDATGHWHAATCGHDVRTDEAGHNGYEEDGICDTCKYVVFRFYTVHVTLPENSVMIQAPDGSNALSFEAKEGTDVVFYLTLPRYMEIINMQGATLSAKGVVEGDNHTYTVTVPAIQSETHVTMELRKNANVQVIVDYEEAILPITQKFYNYGQLTLNIPASGRYIIYSDSSIKFTLAGNQAPQDEYISAYIFDAEAGVLTMDYEYFAMSIPADGQYVFRYVVAMVEKEGTLATLEGNGCIMPTNFTVNMTVKLPAPGFYQMTSGVEGVVLNGTVTQPVILYATAGELEQTVSVMYSSTSEARYIFDWQITPITPLADLTLGDNQYVVKKDVYSALTFTAPYDGAYYLTSGNANAYFFAWVEAEWGNYYSSLGASTVTAEMVKGETMTIFITNNPYESVSGDISCTGQVTYALQTVIDKKHVYNCTSVVGIDNVFVANVNQDTEYLITVLNGDEISIDGGETWHTSLNVIIPANNDLLYYQVRSAGGNSTVKVYIKKAYEFYLDIGTNDAVTMVPEKEYILHLTGAKHEGIYKEYILTWTDPDITVFYEDQEIFSGTAITEYQAGYSYLTAVYSGDTDGSVVFTLAEGVYEGSEDPVPDDPEEPTGFEVNVGRNSVKVEDAMKGVNVIFTATEAGTYTFSYRPGEDNASAMIENATGSEEVDLSTPYEVTLAAGASFIFNLSTVDGTSASIYIIVEKIA